MLAICSEQALPVMVTQLPRWKTQQRVKPTGGGDYAFYRQKLK